MSLPRSFVALMTMVLAAPGIAQQTIEFSQQPFEQALQRAGKEHKPVLIYFTGTGCALCVKMEKQVFVQPEVYKLFNASYVNLESFDDARKPDSATKQLRRRYGIVSNPSFIIVDATGKLVHKAISYHSAEAFTQVGKDGLGNDNYAAWKQEIDKGNYTPATVAKYLGAEQKPVLYAEQGYACPAQQVLDRYFAAVPVEEYSSPFNWKLIEKYVANPYSDVFRYLTNNSEAFISKYGKEAVHRKIFDVYYSAWSGNTGSDHYKKAEAFIRQSADPIARRLIAIRDMYHASEQVPQKDGKAWDAFVERYQPLIEDNNYLVAPFKLYLVASGISGSTGAAPSTIRTANNWMKRVLADPENEDYDYYSVYARTSFLLGDKASALASQQKAIEIAIRENADADDIAELKKTLTLYR